VEIPVAGVPVPTYYHRPDDVAAVLGDDYALIRITGIGVAIPPPYFEPRWQRLPALVRTPLTLIDSALASCPPFNRLGDHTMLQFVKREAAHA
jgi:hypothetical protein